MAKVIWRAGKVGLVVVLVLVALVLILYSAQGLFAEDVGDEAESLIVAYESELSAAKILLKAGKLDEAELAFADVVDNYPGTNDALAGEKGLIMVTIKRGDYDIAAAGVDRILVDYGDYDGMAAALVRIANDFWDANQFEKFKEVYGKIENCTEFSLEKAKPHIENINRKMSTVEFEIARTGKQTKRLIRKQGTKIVYLVMYNDDAGFVIEIEKMINDFGMGDVLLNAIQSIAKDYEKIMGKGTAANVYRMIIGNSDNAVLIREAELEIAKMNAIALIKHKKDNAEVIAAIEQMIIDFGSVADVAEKIRLIGRYYKEFGKSDEAIIVYQKIIDNFSNEVEVIEKTELDRVDADIYSSVNEIDALVKSGDIDGSKTRVDAFIENIDNELVLPEALYNVANLYEKKGYPAEARRVNELCYAKWRGLQNERSGSTVFGLETSLGPVDQYAFLSIMSVWGVEEDAEAKKAILDGVVADFNDIDGFGRSFLSVAEDYWNEGRKKGDVSGDETNVKYNNAISILSRIINNEINVKDITKANAYYVLASCHYRLRNNVQAIEYYQKVLSDWPKFQYTDSVHSLIAVCADRGGRDGTIAQEEADRLFEMHRKAIVEEYPGSTRYILSLRGLGGFYLGKERYNEAIDCYESVIEKDITKLKYVADGYCRALEAVGSSDTAEEVRRVLAETEQ